MLRKQRNGVHKKTSGHADPLAISMGKVSRSAMGAVEAAALTPLLYVGTVGQKNALYDTTDIMIFHYSYQKCVDAGPTADADASASFLSFSADRRGCNLMFSCRRGCRLSLGLMKS